MINNIYRIITNGLKYKIQQNAGFWKIKIWVDLQKPKKGDSLVSEGVEIYNSLEDAEDAIIKLIKHDDADKWRPIPKAMYRKLTKE